jgi:hypothetical protein
VDSDLKDVGLIALSLILFWGQHAEDMIKSLPDQDLVLQYSPCTLLLSKVSPNSLQPYDAAVTLSFANLNLISRLVNIDNDELGLELALLASKIVKMCIQHATSAKEVTGIGRNMGFVDFRRVWEVVITYSQPYCLPSTYLLATIGP